MKYTAHRISLRIPAELHQNLLKEAEKSSKSVNAEIILRLNSSFNKTSLENLDEHRFKQLIRQVIREELNNK